MKYRCILLAFFLVCNITATENTAGDRGGDLEFFNDQNWVEYAGFVEIELYNLNQGMPVHFTDGHYQTINSYPSGTEFRYRLYIENPVYVYAFAGDSGSAETTCIFPPEGQSPVLDYSENGVSFPGESTWICLDEFTGTDYLVTLFARETLDIDQIRKRFEKADGSFTKKVEDAVGANFIPVKNAQYKADEMRFSFRSANSKNIFGLLLAIKHHE